MKWITPKQRQEWLDQAEVYTEIFRKRTKHILPYLARFCLVSGFIEDSIRLWIRWNRQRDHMMVLWNIRWTTATIFYVLNIVTLLIPSIMILFKKKVDIASGILILNIIIQAIMNRTIWYSHFVLRLCSLIGGLILSMAENRKEIQSLFPGVPTLEKKSYKNFMQLAGRVLLVIMFLNIVRYDLAARSIARNLIEGLCMLFIAVGYRTKLFALVLVFYLIYVNFTQNQFWIFRHSRLSFNHMQREFFQTMSVIGGLLFIVAYGPGGVSLDERKKRL